MAGATILENGQHKTPRPRVDFPLPQELQDIIYDFLPGGETTNYIPTPDRAVAIHQSVRLSSTAPRYYFHSAILGVNKTIGREAEESLYNKNGLVLVTIEDVNAAAVLHASDVPVVYEGRVGETKRYAFTINIAWTRSRVNWTSSEGGSDREQYTCTMLLQDLPRLFKMLRMQCQYTAAKCTYVCSEPGEDLLLKSNARDGDEEHTSSPRIEINRVADHPVSKKMQTVFLEALGEAVGAGYDMSIRGFADEVAVQKVKDDISPKLVWRHLYALERLDILFELKKGADTLARAGSFPAAISRNIEILNTGIGRATPAPLQDRVNGTIAYTIHRTRAELLILDISRGLVWIYLQLHRVDLAQELIVYAIAAQGTFRTVEVQLDLAHADLLILTLNAARIEDATQTALRDMVHTLNQVSAVLLPQDVLHDLNEVKRALAKMDKEGGRFELDLAGLSIATMPTRCFNSNIRDFVTMPARTAEDTGLQDLEHLRRLTDEEKKVIVEYQKKNGLLVSKFL
ncbi:hypothetical protein CLAFUW4_06229 [Fulvia fulva]|uniref:Uncharacterized protein n=1 Tax=Passalora fulva TaxID=5499 RepID=A0A9Q8P933_PASFU|nr:uncharacterized protein CLAFUR5_06372 [Fulvia fulva]KAK4623736.1 hypothetical protein CLAFUR4_06232 [Fulvia fulva]KAK4626035.1 hypothetical protein CLAFUR0_06236 [Fulvia fulva]UJO17627.1 hypothetical protein CLAFUR5_06372 [Fulvia fulva]WPV15095.1 hypothetical protein CLAFUW4_06229 [Fulvia fulva]WPV30512.1 hypothetical protein CLAFUW7_06225 [Fulvia fulva]